MSQLNNPHDLLFKETLSKLENAQSFLQNYLPRELLKIVELNTIEIEKDSFITEELQEYFSDLLYKLRFQGQKGYVYVLFEHKSYSEKWIGLQLLEYMLQCWKIKKKQNQPLPPIIPLVVYHGQEKWKAGQQFSDMLELKEPNLLKYVPNFRYVFYDLVRHRDEDLVGIANLKIMLRLLKHIKSPHFIEELAEILRLLVSEGVDMQYLSTVTLYVLKNTEMSPKTFVQLVEKHVSKKGGQAVMTTAEQLIEQGKIEGEIKGKIEITTKMLKKGMDISLIAELADMSKEEIVNLQKRL